MSIEALKGISTIKGDVWSFGVVLWEIVTLGELPYRGVTGLVELHELLLEGARLEKPAHCSEELGERTELFSCDYNSLVRALKPPSSVTRDYTILIMYPPVVIPPKSLFIRRKGNPGARITRTFLLSLHDVFTRQRTSSFISNLGRYKESHSKGDKVDP
ncbi:unnamed protein product, partial [Porites evermanni]